MPGGRCQLSVHSSEECAWEEGAPADELVGGERLPDVGEHERGTFVEEEARRADGERARERVIAEEPRRA